MYINKYVRKHSWDFCKNHSEQKEKPFIGGFNLLESWCKAKMLRSDGTLSIWRSSCLRAVIARGPQAEFDLQIWDVTSSLIQLTDRPYEWVQKNRSHFALPKQGILLLTSAVVSLWSAECFILSLLHLGFYWTCYQSWLKLSVIERSLFGRSTMSMWSCYSMFQGLVCDGEGL